MREFPKLMAMILFVAMLISGCASGGMYDHPNDYDKNWCLKGTPGADTLFHCGGHVHETLN